MHNLLNLLQIAAICLNLKTTKELRLKYATTSKLMDWMGSRSFYLKQGEKMIFRTLGAGGAARK